MVYRKSDKLMVVLYSCLALMILVKNSKAAELDKHSSGELRVCTLDLIFCERVDAQVVLQC